MKDKLSQKSRVERLRDIINLATASEKVTAFDLAVRFNVSPNVIYKDVKELRDSELIPSTWQLEKKSRLSAVEMI